MTVKTEHSLYHIHTRLLLPALLITVLAGVVQPATAQTPAQQDTTPWYQVALVIFKHKNSPMGNETWPTPSSLALSFPKGILSLEPPSETGGDWVAFRAGAPEDEEFKQALRSITLSSNYEIMVKASWNQPALDNEQALPVLIQAGNEFGGYHELEGSITLVVSRYLHFKADLWLSEYIQKVEMIAPWWESSNAISHHLDGSDSLSDTGEELAYQEIDFGAQTYSETVTRYEPVRTVILNESRRMRSGEMHSLDNPMFGVLVKVTPYKPVTEEEGLPDSPLQDASPVSLR